MANGSTLSREELDDRIAILRDNIRQLTEQAAAFSGAADDARSADRIAQQTEELERLLKHRKLENALAWTLGPEETERPRGGRTEGRNSEEPETAGTLPPAG